ACSGLKPAPDGRLRGTYPHLSCSSAPTSNAGASRHTLIEVPLPVAETPHSADTLTVDVGGKYRPEPIPPMPHCFVANVDAALEQQVRNVAQAQRKPDVHQHNQPDDLRRRVEAAERTARLALDLRAMQRR